MKGFSLHFRPLFYVPMALVVAFIATAAICVGKLSVIITSVVIAGLGMVAVTISPIHLFSFYFVYLMFEGAAKIWTNYHPVVHVGSDLLLVFASIRLLNLMRRRGKPSVDDNSVASAHKWILLFLIFYWMWVLLQFVNPSALGLLPSVAGLKLHFVPMLPFLIVSFILRKEEALRLPYILLILGLTQSIFSLVDWQMGPYLLGGLNPRYLEIYQEFLKGAPYRPFGTTHLPGAPSVWISQTLIGALIVGYLETRDPNGGSRLWKCLVIAFLFFSTFALIGCQVRTTLIRFMLTAALGVLMMGRRQAIAAMLVGVLGIVSLTKLGGENSSVEDLKHHETATGKFSQALSRANTLKSIQTFKTARGGTWALDEFRRRSNETMLGIGLSRISASSRPWTAWAARDRIFSSRWGFVDNLFLGIFSEVGIGGLLAYIALAAVLVLQLIQRATFFSFLIALGAVIALLSGYATESLLYQPDASLFWVYAALGFKLGTKRNRLTGGRFVTDPHQSRPFLRSCPQ